MARSSNQKRTKIAIAIIGAGYTEWFYFRDLKEVENLANRIKLKPEKPKNSSYKHIIDKAKNLIKNEYDYAFCIIDMDEIITNKKNLQNYKQAKQNVKKFNRLYNPRKIKIFEVLPCFEFWFLLHYKYTTKIFKNCDGATNSLKKYLCNYDKTIKYFQKNNMYKKLLKNLKKAIKNSKKLNKNRTTNTQPKCDIHKLVQKLHK